MPSSERRLRSRTPARLGAVIALLGAVTTLMTACGLAGQRAFPTLPALPGILGLESTAKPGPPSLPTSAATPTHSSASQPSPTRPSIESALPSPTSCLQARVVNLEFRQPGADESMPMDGVWVPFQVRVTNTCPSVVTAFEFDTEFTDAFKDPILSCSGKVSVRVPLGASRNTAKDTGCTVYADDPAYQSWTTVRKSDLTVDVTITRMVYADGTVVSSTGV